MRVSDISVSRCHALVKYNEESGRFYLEDNLSKFGTLVLAKSSIELEPEMTKAVQIGRSVISFTVKPFTQQQTPALDKPMALKSTQEIPKREKHNEPPQQLDSSFQTPSPQKVPQ